MKIKILCLLLYPFSLFAQLDTVNIGSYARDPQADNIRVAFHKVNDAIDSLNILLIQVDSIFNRLAELRDSSFIPIYEADTLLELQVDLDSIVGSTPSQVGSGFMGLIKWVDDDTLRTQMIISDSLYWMRFLLIPLTLE